MKGRYTPKSMRAFSITCNDAKSDSPAERASASHLRSWRASSSEPMRHAPVNASVTNASGAPCVTSAACTAACSRRSRVIRIFSSISDADLRELSSLGSKTRRACMTKMKRLVFEIGGLHLNREVIDAKTIVKLGAQFAQQVRLRNGVRVNHMRAQRFAPGSDGPNMQIMNVGNTVSVQDSVFNRCKVDMCRRAFEQHIRRLANQPYRSPDNQQANHD